MLAIQNYLRTHGLEKTIKDFSLKTREYEGKILFKYDQLVSPTLGADQLNGGLLAGALGLGLVMLYSLLYYRGLGLVTNCFFGTLFIIGPELLELETDLFISKGNNIKSSS